MIHLSTVTNPSLVVAVAGTHPPHLLLVPIAEAYHTIYCKKPTENNDNSQLTIYKVSRRNIDLFTKSFLFISVTKSFLFITVFRRLLRSSQQLSSCFSCVQMNSWNLIKSQFFVFWHVSTHWSVIADKYCTEGCICCCCFDTLRSTFACRRQW